MSPWAIFGIVLASIVGLLLVGVLIYYIVEAGKQNAAKEDAASQLFSSKVDLNRYAGKWYEIAALPNNFEKDCLCSTATYTLDEKSGTISVLNACQYEDNETKQAKAVGYSTNENNTWLKVNFLPQYLIGNNPAKVKSWPYNAASADYWILHIDEDYGNVLVGSPSKQYLWILSRSPTITKETYTRLATIAKEKGYNTDALQLSCRLLLE